MTNLFGTKHGSHLYGTYLPTSDLDYKYVFVPSMRELLLQKGAESISTQSCGVDYEYHSLHKFIKMVLQGQAIALETLFSPQDSWLYRPADEWFELLKIREHLLSKNISSFFGYARKQANIYSLKGQRMNELEHMVVLLAGLSANSRLEEYDSYLTEAVKNLDYANIEDIEIRPGETIKHLNINNKKTPFTFTVKQALDLYSKMYEEYGSRAKLAKEQENVDWKAMAHAVRIARQAIDLLNNHELVFPLPYAKELLDIRQGNASYEKVAEMIERLFHEMETAKAKSTLPDNPNTLLAENFVYGIYKRSL